MVTVTALSTLAMVLYPFISGWCGFDHIDAGIFLGGTIHDVAQVVGAGAMIGPDALEIASLTKMIRVALLIPILIIFMFVFSSKAHRTEEETSQALVQEHSDVPARLHRSGRFELHWNYSDECLQHTRRNLQTVHFDLHFRPWFKDLSGQTEGSRLDTDRSDEHRYRLPPAVGYHRYLPDPRLT